MTSPLLVAGADAKRGHDGTPIPAHSREIRTRIACPGVPGRPSRRADELRLVDAKWVADEDLNLRLGYVIATFRRRAGSRKIYEGRRVNDPGD